MTVPYALDDFLYRSAGYHRDGDLARHVASGFLSMPFEHTVSHTSDFTQVGLR